MRQARSFWLTSVVCLLASLPLDNCLIAQSGSWTRISDSTQIGMGDNHSTSSNADVIPAASYQPTPLLEPRLFTPNQNPANVTSRGSSILAAPRPSAGITFPSSDVVLGGEAGAISATDVGNLLKKSNSALSATVQAKTPIVNDPRIRGSRAGALAASGSYWVPARADLDTIVSKFDSRQIDSVNIVPGPYTSLLGPGFSFSDVQLLRSPRFSNGPQWSGNTAAEYRSNGGQFFGQQGLSTGAKDWGALLNYVNRNGGDYRSGGDNVVIPSSYKSNEFLFAWGRDWKDDSLEFSFLRLDQNDMVFPGYVFDIDVLATTGGSVKHTHRFSSIDSACQTEIWYNQTGFNGHAQNPRKRAFFPVLNQLNYVGFTDVESISTGYSQRLIHGLPETYNYRVSIGHDLRFVKQELNEISSGTTLLGLPLPFVNRNSPIPRSFWINPGLFAEYNEEIEAFTLTTGGRLDYAGTDIDDDPAKLNAVGLDTFPASYQNIVGTNQYRRDFFLLSGFMRLRHDLTDKLSNSVSLGYAERTPTLTELYAAQPFLLVLQNGLNNVTGDPALQKERLFQVDLGAEFSSRLLKSGIRGYHAWAWDYITYENTRVNTVPPAGDVGQVSLRFVNTDLATFLGFEWFNELMPDEPLTPFLTIKAVDGRDRTRNGSFATRNGTALAASQKVAGLSRGAFSGILGADSEPLPGITPLESRTGVRIKDPSANSSWNGEIAARLVSRQTKVAASLLETPTAGFGVVDIRGNYRSPRFSGLALSAGVENLFDRKYREHLDFRTQSGLAVFQPGANFYFSANLNY